jgi:uncharacterized protein (DUF58 family)
VTGFRGAASRRESLVQWPAASGRLGFAAAVVVLGVLLAPSHQGIVLWVGNGVVVALAGLDLALAPSPRSVAVARGLPGIVALGGQGTVTWRVTNPARRRLRVAVADQLAPSLRADRRGLRLTLPPRGTITATSEVRPTRRGRFELEELTVRVYGPIGLVARQRRRLEPGVLRVYPPFKSRDEAELRIDRARILEIGIRSARGLGGGTEFEQLREYSVDDEFRRMDWSATARAGKPIVRTYRAERNQTVLVLLDCGRVMAGRVENVPRVEHAMDAVMMLTYLATRLGDKAGLVAFGSRVDAVVSPSHNGNQLARVTEAMYAIEPELAESDYRGAVTETLSRFRRRALLVVLTDLHEQAVTETLLPVLPLVLRSHVIIVGAVRDPDVERWARSVPTDASAAYRKAAAVKALDERARLAARLRGAGATVVDAPPGALAPRLADAYLRVKATGRL